MMRRLETAMRCSRCEKVIPATVRFCAYCGERQRKLTLPFPGSMLFAYHSL